MSGSRNTKQQAGSSLSLSGLPGIIYEFYFISNFLLIHMVDKVNGNKIGYGSDVLLQSAFVDVAAVLI